MTYKRIWTKEEDDFLRNHAQFHIKKNWIKISEIFNQTFHCGGLRSAKQCRQRYINHVNTTLDQPFTRQWTHESLNFLFQLYQEYGHKWTLIAKLMQNKSENVVKNKFYCGMRKFIRKLNKYLKSHNKKYKKQIKYQSIMRILDANDCFLDLSQQTRLWNTKIRKNIIQLTLKSIRFEQFKQQQIDQLTQNINKFNLISKNYKIKKLKINQKNLQEIIKSSNNNILNNLIQQHSIPISNQHNLINKPSTLSLTSTLNFDSFDQLKLQDKSLESTHQLSASQIYQDFGVSLIEQDHYKSNQFNKDIFDLMLPQTFTPLTFQELL